MPISDADIIPTEITADNLMCPFYRNMFAAFTDDQAKLRFIVELIGDYR